jgi:hypothetical protein
MEMAAAMAGDEGGKTLLELASQIERRGIKVAEGKRPKNGQEIGFLGERKKLK